MIKGASLPSNEQERLAALYALNILDTPLEERFDRFVRLAKHLFDVPIAMISIVDAERQWLKAYCGVSSQNTPRSQSFCAYTLFDNTSLIVPDALDDHRFMENPMVTGEPHIRFYAGYPIHDRHGHALGALCIIDTIPRHFHAHDLETLRQLARLVDQEIDLTNARAAALPLWKQSQRFHNIFDDAAIGIALLDELHHFLEWNTTFEHILGYQRETLQDLSLLDIIDSDVNASDQLQALFQHNLPGLHIQHRYMRKDGMIRDLQITLSLTHDALSEQEACIVIIEDITDQKDTERQLKKATLEMFEKGEILEEIQKQQMDFISGVSHEFRTTLTSILGFSELQQSEDFTLAEVRDFATDIYHDALRLVRMINSLLDLKRIKEGKTQLRLEMLSIGDLIRKQIHSSEVTTVKHTFRLILDENVAQIEGDRDKLVQVIANLLSNAIKYSPHGGQITLDCQQNENTLHIQIQDQGIGISPDALDKIFDDYSRIDSEKTRYIQGTGLGLAIVKQIVQMHGGKVWAESQQMEGTTFHVVLPIHI
jgi:PAS domain S-box-containing protein